MAMGGFEGAVVVSGCFATKSEGAAMAGVPGAGDVGVALFSVLP
jgi:hypothetical protein